MIRNLLVFRDKSRTTSPLRTTICTRINIKFNLNSQQLFFLQKRSRSLITCIMSQIFFFCTFYDGNATKFNSEIQSRRRTTRLGRRCGTCSSHRSNLLFSWYDIYFPYFCYCIFALIAVSSNMTFRSSINDQKC